MLALRARIVGLFALSCSAAMKVGLHDGLEAVVELEQLRKVSPAPRHPG